MAGFKGSTGPVERSTGHRLGDQGNEQPGRVSGQPDTPALYLLAEAKRQTRLLTSFLLKYAGAHEHIAAANTGRQSRQIKDWPIQGVDRYIRATTGFGQAVTLAATVAQVVLPQNEARMGLEIVNSGSNSCVLWLANLGDTTAAAARPQIFLAAATSPSNWWHGVVGGTQWCGDVCAISTAGTTLTVAEI